MITALNSDHYIAKPVLKWAGGKTQLLHTIAQYSPKDLGTKTRKYIEPFLGGGAVFFNLYHSGLIDSAIIMDSNADLVLLYRTLQTQPNNVTEILFAFQKKYSDLGTSEREKYFYETRQAFNDNRKDNDSTENPFRAAQIIFLNHTCFNGLYRVNRKQQFNVPHGRYHNPKILNEENIVAASRALQIAEILNFDFKYTEKIATPDHFIYYDPPYKPISNTSHFNSYSGLFNDTHQIELAEMFKKLNISGIQQMLSNSDPLNANGNTFFDELYNKFNIYRVDAKRKINSNGTKRGVISELLITNY